MKALRVFLTFFGTGLLLFLPFQSLAFSDLQQHHVDWDTPWYDETATAGCNTNVISTVSGDVIIRFLQALAFKESGGRADYPPNGGGASGKYQYIQPTWQGSAKAHYPPGAAYSQAYQAPETTQDAVAYLEYAEKFKSLGGDLFKLAVSHYLPEALTNPAKLDQVPFRGAGNVLTPRQYADGFIHDIQSGAGSKIPVNPQNAPDFAKYAQQQGAPIPTGTGGTETGGGLPGGCSSGAVKGSIVQTALNFAWNTWTGHTGPDSARPEYKAAWNQYDKQSDMTDCGAFVATVMIASGVDPGYPKVGTDVQLNYVKTSGKYDIIAHPTNTSQLQPGDILIYPNGSSSGHTMIYVGPQPGNYSAVDASLNSHTPQAVPNIQFMFDRNDTVVARIKAGD